MTLEALTPKKFTETDYDTAHTRETLHSSSTSLGGLALEHAGNEQIHEKKEINNRAYPRDYFTAQILFAKKWSDITGEPLPHTLSTKTAVTRAIWGNTMDEHTAEEQENALAQLTKIDNADDAASLLYEIYKNKPQSLYSPPDHAGAFGYDYYPETDTVKVHFKNPVRGENPFEDLEERRADFKNMLQGIKADHPEAKKVVSASWIRSIKQYRDLFPPSIVEQDMMSSDMFLRGDSTWGQLIDRNGFTNQKVYSAFTKGIESAQSVDDLIEAFPRKVSRVEDDIDTYYKFYDVKS